MTSRRTMLATLLIATAWTESVIVQPGVPPRLSIKFGGEDGMSGLDIEVGGRTFRFSPADIAAALERELPQSLMR